MNSNEQVNFKGQVAMVTFFAISFEFGLRGMEGQQISKSVNLLYCL